VIHQPLKPAYTRSTYVVTQTVVNVTVFLPAQCTLHFLHHNQSFNLYPVNHSFGEICDSIWSVVAAKVSRMVSTFMLATMAQLMDLLQQKE